MMKFLFLIMMIAIVGGIIGIIFIIKSIKKNIDKEYKGANIISLLFPIVGLIIYAVNVGKNDKLAKSCIKMTLYGMAFAVVLSIIVSLSLYGAYVFTRESVVEVKGNRINTPQNVDKKEEYDNLDALNNELLENDFITNCQIDKKGKIIYIIIEYKDNDFYDKKAVINSIIKKFDLDKRYDYYININDEDTGLYRGTKNSDIVWDNQ